MPRSWLLLARQLLSGQVSTRAGGPLQSLGREPLPGDSSSSSSSSRRRRRRRSRKMWSRRRQRRGRMRDMQEM